MSLFDFLNPPEELTVLRGPSRVDPEDAEVRAREFGGNTGRLLDAPVPEPLRSRGVVLQGGQGSGKTATIVRNLETEFLRMTAEGEEGRRKIIVVDVKGDLTPIVLALAKTVHPQPPVHLLNPFDKFAVALDPHEFTDEPTKIMRLVQALTYRRRDARTDDFFDSSARNHLVDLVKILHRRMPGRWTWRDFYLIATDYDLLEAVLKNSRIGRRKAKMIVKKTFAGIVATIESWLGQYEAAFACFGLSPAFRLDRFMKGRGVLVLTVPEDQRDSLNPVARTVLRSVKDRLLTDNGQDPRSHTTIVLDEFAYLERCVEVIEPLFGRARSANASLYCAWQSWPAVCEAHGERAMKGVLDNAALRVFFSSGADSAEVAARECTAAEVKRLDVSETIGQSPSRTVSYKLELRKNVLPGEVQGLRVPTPADPTVRAFLCASHLGGPLYCEEDYSALFARQNALPRVSAFRPRPPEELWVEPWDDVADGNRLEPLFVRED